MLERETSPITYMDPMWKIVPNDDKNAIKQYQCDMHALLFRYYHVKTKMKSTIAPGFFEDERGTDW